GPPAEGGVPLAGKPDRGSGQPLPDPRRPARVLVLSASQDGRSSLRSRYLVATVKGRSFHPGGPGSERADPLSSGRPANAPAPGHVRSDWPATNSGRDRCLSV